MKPPITATKLRTAVDATRRSGRLRHPDPIPIVHLALVADVAAATAMRELIVGRGARSDKRVADLVRGLSRVPGAIAAALSNARALAWSFYEPEDALRLARASASGIHIRCQEAFHEGREMRRRGPRTRRTKGT